MTAATIFALASGGPGAAISVMRLSGPACSDLIMKLGESLPAPRRASLRALRNAEGAILDKALVLWMPGPGTYTGEDCGELHLHGGRAVLAAVTAALLAAGARLAEPGEFTRRAFVNGRMDLLEAEGVADLVAAETNAQRVIALRQMSGVQSRLLDGWASRLRRVLAWQEALIDFPDEALPAETEAALLAEIEALQTEIAAAVADGERGIRLRQGVTIAVVGAPNAGKSSLVNVLAERDIAIVTPIPGTTRDALEAPITLGGAPVTLIDTAGLRETTDPIEAEGVKRARARAAQADIVLHVWDAAHGENGAGLPDMAPDALWLSVANKIDLAAHRPEGAIAVSAMTGEGISVLRTTLADAVQQRSMPAGQAVMTRARHVAALREAHSHLSEAYSETLEELRGEALRLAMRAIGRITGSVDAEALLDTIFRDFCIGK